MTRCRGPASIPGNVWSLHGYHECLVRLGMVGAGAIIGQAAHGKIGLHVPLDVIKAKSTPYFRRNAASLSLPVGCQPIPVTFSGLRPG
jgi:hypothetical protein